MNELTPVEEVEREADYRAVYYDRLAGFKFFSEIDPFIGRLTELNDDEKERLAYFYSCQAYLAKEDQSFNCLLRLYRLGVGAYKIKAELDMETLMTRASDINSKLKAGELLCRDKSSSEVNEAYKAYLQKELKEASVLTPLTLNGESIGALVNLGLSDSIVDYLSDKDSETISECVLMIALRGDIILLERVLDKFGDNEFNFARILRRLSACPRSVVSDEDLAGFVDKYNLVFIDNSEYGNRLGLRLRRSRVDYNTDLIVSDRNLLDPVVCRELVDELKASKNPLGNEIFIRSLDDEFYAELKRGVAEKLKSVDGYRFVFMAMEIALLKDKPELLEYFQQWHEMPQQNEEDDKNLRVRENSLKICFGLRQGSIDLDQFQSHFYSIAELDEKNRGLEQRRFIKLVFCCSWQNKEILYKIIGHNWASIGETGSRDFRKIFLQQFFSLGGTVDELSKKCGIPFKEIVDDGLFTSEENMVCSPAEVDDLHFVANEIRLYPNRERKIEMIGSLLLSSDAILQGKGEDVLRNVSWMVDLEPDLLRDSSLRNDLVFFKKKLLLYQYISGELRLRDGAIRRNLGEGLLDDMKGIFSDKEIAKLRAIGVDYSDLSRKWMANENSEFDHHLNLETMLKIEEQRRGACEKIYKGSVDGKYGKVYFFTRYPIELLLQRFNIEDEERVGIFKKRFQFGIYAPVSDHNGAFNHTVNTLARVYDQAEDGAQFYVQEVDDSDWEPAIEALPDLDVRLVMGHGTPEGLAFERNKITVELISEVLLRIQKQRSTLSPCLNVFYSCNTGVAGGFVDKLVGKKINSVGPAFSPVGVSIDLNFDNDGKIVSVLVSYQSKDDFRRQNQNTVN